MALTAARELFQSKNAPKTRSVRMAASTTIYKGGYVMIDANGVAVPAAAGAANHGSGYIATETVTSDASTPTYIKVQYGGPFLVTGQNLAQARVGEIVYCDDDETVNSGASAASNTPPFGQLTEFVSATQGWVETDPALNFVVGPHA